MLFLVLMSFIDEAILDQLYRQERFYKTRIDRSQIIDKKYGDFSSFKIAINEFFTA